jgi:drug/metabolite transporter (DMT)-like permease
LILRQPLATAHPKLHLSRSLSGVSSLALFTYAVMALPLATGVTLNYTSPVWLAMLVVGMAVIKGIKKPRPAMLLCIVASMVGVGLLLKPIFAAGPRGLCFTTRSPQSSLAGFGGRSRPKRWT